MSASVQSANLIANWIAQIGEVEFSTALAPTGRVLNALSAARYARVVEGFDLVRAVAGEPYGAAIGMLSRTGRSHRYWKAKAKASSGESDDEGILGRPAGPLS